MRLHRAVWGFMLMKLRVDLLLCKGDGRGTRERVRETTQTKEVIGVRRAGVFTWRHGWWEGFRWIERSPESKQLT